MGNKHIEISKCGMSSNETTGYPYIYMYKYWVLPNGLAHLNVHARLRRFLKAFERSNILILSSIYIFSIFNINLCRFEHFEEYIYWFIILHN